MLRVEFEPTIPVVKLENTVHVVDSAANVIGLELYKFCKFVLELIKHYTMKMYGEWRCSSTHV
jgi:hypothetical protein